MKELIGAVASVILILALIVQFVGFQTLGVSLVDAENQVNAFATAVSKAGCVKEGDKARLRKSLSRILRCQEGDIDVSGPEKEVKRGEIMEIKVTAPVTGVIRDPGFWKVDAGENGFLFRADRCCISGSQGAKVQEKKEGGES